MKEFNLSGTKLLFAIILAVSAIIASFAGGFVIGKSSNPQLTAFIDDFGRSVKLQGFPDRIISVAPTPTEILFAVGAGDRVIGIDDYSDYPLETANVTKVGNYTLKVEKIVSLEPDLIISSDLVPQSQLDTLETHGIPYMILAARSLDDVYKDIRLIGSVTNNSAKANELVNSLQDRVSAVTLRTLNSTVTKTSVYLEYSPMWTFGPGSFGDDLIRLAGGDNIAKNESTEYPLVTSEFVVAHNPKIIIFTSGFMAPTTVDDIKSRPGWDQIDAVKNEKIVPIDDNLISRYGPRIVDGLEQLAEILHPDLFD